MLGLLQRYAHVALFVICELIAFILIVNFNQKQRDIFLHSSSLFSASLLKKSDQFQDYLSLQQSNEGLLSDNARLLKEIINMPRPEVPIPDSSLLRYEVHTARIINNRISSFRNFLTIDKGTNHGVKPSQGVVTLDGVVGVVNLAKDNFATIVSLLNIETRISASIEGEDFFGTITWNGKSYNQLTLSGIPIHATVIKGKKVITNGFSTIFPKGQVIGTVDSFSKSKDGAFYVIDVLPSVDLTQLSSVYILKDNFAEEILLLEENE